MTTEIAVLNKCGVALAADSAVTTSQKIFQTANKIFSLSKVHPLGAMVFSHADLMGLPWEIIIKDYRDRLSSTLLDTVDSHAAHFFAGVKKYESGFYPEKLYVRMCCDEFVDKVRAGIRRNIERRLETAKFVRKTTIAKINREYIHKNFALAAKAKDLDLRQVVDFSSFVGAFESEIQECYSGKLRYYAGDVEDLYDKFRKAAYDICTKEFFPAGFSGLVFAGYGAGEIFPSVECYHCGGVILGHPAICKNAQRSARITSSTASVIRPFAQDDVISMFIEGIAPRFDNNVRELIDYLFDGYTQTLFQALDLKYNGTTKEAKMTKKIRVAFLDKLNDTLDKYKRKNHITPIMSIVSTLPASELARLADTLVSLTSIKRQMSFDKETVGGPTDVALITKSDGFVWIKRKHYFDGAINHQFFANYFRGIPS